MSISVPPVDASPKAEGASSTKTTLKRPSIDSALRQFVQKARAADMHDSAIRRTIMQKLDQVLK